MSRTVIVLLVVFIAIVVYSMTNPPCGVQIACP